MGFTNKISLGYGLILVHCIQLVLECKKKVKEAILDCAELDIVIPNLNDMHAMQEIADGFKCLAAAQPEHMPVLHKSEAQASPCLVQHPRCLVASCASRNCKPCACR